MEGTYEWVDLVGNREEHFGTPGLTPEGALIFRDESMITTLVVAPGQWVRVYRTGD